MKEEHNADMDGHQLQTKPPTILDGLIQPHFPFARVFTCFFLKDCLVFTKTGGCGTNASGTMRSALGGFTPAAMLASAIGTIVDMFHDQSRASNAAGMAAFSPENMVASHKRNFMFSYCEIKSVEIKGPNIAGELKVIINADKTYKFRIDRQSKESANYIRRVFNEFTNGGQV